MAEQTSIFKCSDGKVFANETEADIYEAQLLFDEPNSSFYEFFFKDVSQGYIKIVSETNDHDMFLEYSLLYKLGNRINLKDKKLTEVWKAEKITKEQAVALPHYQTFRLE